MSAPLPHTTTNANANASANALKGKVDAARLRLGRAHIRAAVVRHAAIVLGAAAACAASRPFVWALHDAPPWKAVLRTLLLAAVGASAVVLVLIVRAWRSRPSMLTSARKLDEALGLVEVVASGFAFERDAAAAVTRSTTTSADANAMKSVAVERAHSALEGVVLERVLVPTKPAPRSRKESRLLRGAAVAAALGLGIGSIDRLVVERTIHPVTARESTAAQELKRAADALAKNNDDKNKANDPNKPPKNPKAEEVADAARRASEAAERGDRKRALDALEDMRKASRAMEAEEREQARSLRALRDEVEGRAGGKAKAGEKDESARPGRPSATASEALAKLKADLEASKKDPEALKKLAERLERAEAAARDAGEKAAREREKSAMGKPGHKDKSGKDGEAGKEGREKESGWSRAAAALKEAREASARGDTEGAKRAMERAEREIAALEKEAHDPSKASAMAKMSDDASELDRSLRAGMSGGKDGKEGKEGKDGKGGSPKDDGEGGDGTSKSASKDKSSTDPSGKPGGGPGGSDRAPGASQDRRVKVNGSLQARTDVREGEKAVSAIEGMGRGGDPKAYREIFPSYDTVVEDGLREEVVPAARRPTVRRYFSLIRPVEPGSTSDDDNKNENRRKP